MMGAAIFIQDARSKFDALETLEMLHSYPITTFCAPPTVYRIGVSQSQSSPDEMRNEVVKAFVILATGYTASAELAKDLQEHVKRVTAPYKYPREIEFVESLPKTISGKIRRVELRELERKMKQGNL